MKSGGVNSARKTSLKWHDRECKVESNGSKRYTQVVRGSHRLTMWGSNSSWWLGLIEDLRELFNEADAW